MPSKIFIAGEEKSMPGFKVSEDGLTLLLGLMQLMTLHRSRCSFTILKTLGPLRIMLNRPCPCSVNGTTKSGWQHICSQHALLNIVSPLLRPAAQEKKIPFKILLLVNSLPGHPRALMERDNEFNIVFLSTNTASSL